ncbi:uncharacterized protein BJ171DRAFT_517464 [Polychytrium aggregatum]|uniref:uncharacterized protein n=1 Tax=Polychytrium aggregatum TaxID=110093 RepID=UPI0022FE6CEB|nr:uncharacterized protein BJ171DRAFT_517464 [Polychytrium aggregatum]KAI9199681.1 hypothetical protein BJ171DRAFT_517464 [Polychytrium aggregatum]
MAASIESSHSATQPLLDLHPDLFTVLCLNDGFRLALDHITVRNLFLVCRRAQRLLPSKVARFHDWCKGAGLCRPDGLLQISLTPSEMMVLAAHYCGQEATDRSWIISLSDQGNIAASYFLGRVLQADTVYRTDITRPELEAMGNQMYRLFESCAQAGHSKARYQIAECYRKGYGVDQDDAKAAEIYRGLAVRGLCPAQVALGRYYENGEGVEQDLDAAVEWFTKAINQGSRGARPRVAFIRGWFSFIGHGVEQSDTDAFNRWQELAAELADPDTKRTVVHMIGWMHYLGRGTPQNKQKGVKMIRENAADDFIFGEDQCLASAWSVTDKSSAARKFFKLCRMGSERDWLCKQLMATCLLHGVGVERNHAAAAEAFAELANQGYSPSQYLLGHCYANGKGVPRDDSKAFSWYSKAAAQDDSYGQVGVGRCYETGSGVPRDAIKAIEWFRKSAVQGNSFGQHKLGSHYRDGSGVAQDLDAALYWYRKSADQGNVMGRRDLGRLQNPW